MTAAMFEDPEGQALVAAIHERKAAAAFDAQYRRQWIELFEAVMGVPYESLPLRRPERRPVSEVERVAAKYTTGGQQ